MLGVPWEPEHEADKEDNGLPLAGVSGNSSGNLLFLPKRVAGNFPGNLLVLPTVSSHFTEIHQTGPHGRMENRLREELALLGVRAGTAPARKFW